MSEPIQYDYLFVSDLHISQGYDPEQRTFHPREDFFFDDSFFRWLRWADAHCEPGRRWELVFVGDGFDFLPFDQQVVDQVFAEYDRRQQEIDLNDPSQVVRYWQELFASPSARDKMPTQVQQLLFEEDVLEGRIRLAPAPTGEVAVMGPAHPPLPEWTTSIYRRAHPELEITFGLEPSAGALTLAAGEPLGRHTRDPNFERRYGLLPTPEASAAKATSIYHGHRTFFRGLAWFVARGHRVVFARGNHDLELYWPAVQERLRASIAAEYPAATGQEEGASPPPGFMERIDFPGWFYYKKGLFYAEHGQQYESLNSCANPIRPLLPNNNWVLNPPVGSLTVTCIHTQLEDEYPEWENRGQMAIAMLELIRRHPLQTIAILLRHGPDFLRMARRLWRFEKGEDPGPNDDDWAHQAQLSGLSTDTLRRLYGLMSTPLLLRRPSAWFLFSPLGHVLKAALLLLAAALLLLWYVVGVPALAGLIPPDFPSPAIGPSLQLLVKLLLWLVLPPALARLWRQQMGQAGSGPFLRHAAQRIHQLLKQEDPQLRFYIFGHTHRTDATIVERRPNHEHVTYLNTGCWFAEFAAGARRLQTMGAEVQFTFVRLVQRDTGAEAELLRWNDDAERAERQVLLSTK